MMVLNNPPPSRFEFVSSGLTQRGTESLFPLSKQIELLDMTVMRWQFPGDDFFKIPVHQNVLVEIDFLQGGQSVLNRETRFYFYAGYNAVPLSMIKPKDADAVKITSNSSVMFRLNSRLLLKD